MVYVGRILCFTRVEYYALYGQDIMLYMSSILWLLSHVAPFHCPKSHLFLSKLAPFFVIVFYRFINLYLLLFQQQFQTFQVCLIQFLTIFNDQTIAEKSCLWDRYWTLFLVKFRHFWLRELDPKFKSRTCLVFF